MKILLLINYIRTLPMYMLMKLSGQEQHIRNDIKKYLYYIPADENVEFLIALNNLLLRNTCFRNVFVFRLSSKNVYCGYIARVLFPIKKDLEIYGSIGDGLAIYHGHGTVLNANSIGTNFSVYQGVTLGRNTNSRNRSSNIVTPTIGDNVTVYANAVVVGGIHIGNNVSIGAGAVVMKNVPDNCKVIGNPCRIIEAHNET